MAKSRSDSGADLSDYKYWRSQHRPLGGGEEEERPPKLDTFEDAVFNRFGEETGQSLHGLLWPQVPPAWKNMAGMIGGRLLPMLSAYRQYRKVTEKVFEKKTVAQKLYEKVDVEIDGKKVTPDWSDMGELFEQLCSAKYFWTVRPWQSSSRVLKFDLEGAYGEGAFGSKERLTLVERDERFDGGSGPVQQVKGPDGKWYQYRDEYRAGVLQVDGTTVKVPGIELEVGIQKRGLLALERFELLKQFLRNEFSRRFRKEFDVVRRLKDLEKIEKELNINDIKWTDKLNQVDPEALEEILFTALCLEWLKTIDSAF